MNNNLSDGKRYIYPTVEEFAESDEDKCYVDPSNFCTLEKKLYTYPHASAYPERYSPELVKLQKDTDGQLFVTLKKHRIMPDRHQKRENIIPVKSPEILLLFRSNRFDVMSIVDYFDKYFESIGESNTKKKILFEKKVLDELPNLANEVASYYLLSQNLPRLISIQDNSLFSPVIKKMIDLVPTLVENISSVALQGEKEKWIHYPELKELTTKITDNINSTTSNKPQIGFRRNKG